MSKKFLARNVRDHQWSSTPNELSIECDTISDGYHTFDELHDHRRALTIALFNRLKKEYYVCKSKLHNDGTMFEGYFIVWALLPWGQISYHYDLKYWDDFNLTEELKIPVAYDGHTANDVIDRLQKIEN